MSGDRALDEPAGYWWCERCKSKVSHRGIVHDKNGLIYHTKRGEHPVRFIRFQPKQPEAEQALGGAK